ncbi:MAG: RDD family protein [Candidatus Eremiobacteraeota bacterium]|nr:RDD family protein [Candidatus Eremiobacteraeota bacterium]
MDRTIAVRTPESIAFDYELAGLGSRFLAVFVDLLIQVICALALIWALTAIAIRSNGHAIKSTFSDRTVESLAIAILVILGFLIFFGYFIIFERAWNGQTPGKRLVGIRVVRDGGFAIDFTSSLVRNLVRVLEAALGFYAISALSTLLSSENKRLGDFAAGTIVVRDSRITAPVAPRSESAIRLTPQERALIDRFLERRESLAAAQRQALASQIATIFRARVGEPLASLGDEALIERIVSAS